MNEREEGILIKAVEALKTEGGSPLPPPGLTAMTLQRLQAAEARARRPKPILHRYATLAAAALILLAGAVALLHRGPNGTVYAIDQTGKAIERVRHLHMVSRGEDGSVRDERWIEIGPHGRQTRYRQDTAGRLLVIEDGATVMAYHRDRDTVVLHDPKDKQYQFIGNWQGFFHDLEGEPGNVVIHPNVAYKGRDAHRIRWLKTGTDIYIDPESKLPVAMAGYEITYEEPPEGVFEVRLPEGVPVVDKRPGAVAGGTPESLEDSQPAEESFNRARRALADARYDEAAELFSRVIQVEPGQNWAIFWRGAACAELGKLEEAVRDYDRVIVMLSEYPGMGLEYCHLARGLAYRKLGRQEAARQDFAAALPAMILGLRHAEARVMFDYADEPLYRDGRKPDEQQSLMRMVERLREVTSQEFGYVPNGTPEQNERALSAWERWWQERAADYREPR